MKRDSDDIAKKARAAIPLWESDPRQALARLLGIQPGQVTDDMVARATRGPSNLRNPPLQQIQRTPGRRR